MRAIVAETLVDLPMLRSVERRMVLEVRPNVDWNRAHAVEWLVSSVVEQVWPRLDCAASPSPSPPEPALLPHALLPHALLPHGRTTGSALAHASGSRLARQVGVKGAMPIYIGTDPDFSHISACNGLYIPITGGPGADGYFLRSTSQVEELLRWFSEMHAAGVTVRGGRLRPQKQKPSSAGSGSYTNLGKGTSRRA